MAERAGELRAVVRANRIGEVRHPQRPVRINDGLEARRITVTNRSDHAVRVSSHFPFWRANPRLEFDRDAARGCHLDLVAGASLRWAPGETLDVDLVRYGRAPEAGTVAPAGERG